MNFLRNIVQSGGVFSKWWRRELPSAPESSNSDDVEFCRKSNYPRNSCEAQWMLLYTCITSLEDQPSEARLKIAKDFIRNIPDQCRFTRIGETFSEGLKEFDHSISKAKSKRELLLTLCSIENKCRHKLGKPLVICNYSEIMKRWYGRKVD
ncbi:hypothetical protein OIY81_1498 [Cryptosporidium canis]|uniref:Sulfhydryl oxidase n=1 Tax=Cryptosporidium canis TaxID=195482 RepID=A0ABQ8P927_9CRYT|nr:hypothetical protein OIY81_1498 [Cryptosporidium canis]KAJ1612447.1 hypothetical protein OJ252_1268 [Cryptosporidium canis]